jgi:hypothetical protein
LASTSSDGDSAQKVAWAFRALRKPSAWLPEKASSGQFARRASFRLQCVFSAGRLGNTITTWSDMAPPTVWYFAYGSNLSRAVMQSRAGQILDAQLGRLENYELLFNKKVRGGTAEANIQPARGKTVLGVLYKLTETALRSLDRSTGVPGHYRRIEVSAFDSAGNKISAQAYIASKVEKGLRPAGHYLQTILEGATENGLPEHYLEAIRKAAGISLNGNGR